MRIGIITHHWVYNFGANLQAISTDRILRKLGHDAWIINYRPIAKEERYRQSIPAQQVEQHEQLCEKFMNQTPLCRTETDIVKVCREFKFDAIWVGSDAMFRLIKDSTEPDHIFPNPYWLQWTTSCMPDIPLKGTLAVSAMGTNFLDFPRSIRKGIADAIREMNFVSVRDYWTQFMLFLVSKGCCRPKFCPDPVFVLNDVFTIPEDYSTRFPFAKGKYILLSVNPGQFSDQWVKDFVKRSHQHGMQVLSLPFPEDQVDLPVDCVIPLPLSPLSWYSLIKNARGFIGYRMHPVACSLANSVPFISIDTYGSSRLKLYKKSLDIRFSSKTYDLCFRAGVKQFCLSRRQLRQFTPEGALILLLSKEQKNADRFVRKAKQTFARVVDQLISC